MSTDVEFGRLPVRGRWDCAGHIDGFGWKASDTGGGDVPATWTGPIDGAEQTITIEFDGKPARHMYGAGECLVIATYRPHHLDDLHRLCTS